MEKVVSFEKSARQLIVVLTASSSAAISASIVSYRQNNKHLREVNKPDVLSTVHHLLQSLVICAR